MSEYTYDNILINPSKEGIENLIGKEVYFHVHPYRCLDNANKNSSDYLGILTEIHAYSSRPFHVKKKSGAVYSYPCIIPKDKEPEYIPFRSAAEFLYAYSHTETKNLDGVNYYLETPGIWLKYKSTKVNVYSMVTDFWDNGLAIISKMNKDGTVKFNDTVSWSELLEDYEFLDGTPCGVLKNKNREV